MNWGDQLGALEGMQGDGGGFTGVVVGWSVGRSQQIEGVFR